MDNRTQQTHSMIEESAAASQTMKNEVMHLVELMEFFNLSKDVEAVEDIKMIE